MVGLCYDDASYDVCVAYSTAWQDTMRHQLATAGAESPDFVETVLDLLFTASLLDSPKIENDIRGLHHMEACLRHALRTAQPVTLTWEVPI